MGSQCLLLQEASGSNSGRDSSALVRSIGVGVASSSACRRVPSTRPCPMHTGCCRPGEPSLVQVAVQGLDTATAKVPGLVHLMSLNHDLEYSDDAPVALMAKGSLAW